MTDIATAPNRIAWDWWQLDPLTQFTLATFSGEVGDPTTGALSHVAYRGLALQFFPVNQAEQHYDETLSRGVGALTARFRDLYTSPREFLSPADVHQAVVHIGQLTGRAYMRPTTEVAAGLLSGEWKHRTQGVTLVRALSSLALENRQSIAPSETVV